MQNLSTGDGNTTIGTSSGNFINTGDGNVCVGLDSGPTNLLGALDDLLYISNFLTDTPLIGGDFATDNVTLRGTLRFTERADHILTPTSTFAELWVRDDQHLIFTDDSGTDHDLTP